MSDDTSNKFDIMKLLSSPFTGIYWVKCMMIGLGVFMIIFIGYGMYKAYIKKPEPTTAQKAETIENYYVTPHFGCAGIKFYQDAQKAQMNKVK